MLVRKSVDSAGENGSPTSAMESVGEVSLLRLPLVVSSRVETHPVFGMTHFGWNGWNAQDVRVRPTV